MNLLSDDDARSSTQPIILLSTQCNGEAAPDSMGEVRFTLHMPGMLLIVAHSVWIRLGWCTVMVQLTTAAQAPGNHRPIVPLCCLPHLLSSLPLLMQLHHQTPHRGSDQLPNSRRVFRVHHMWDMSTPVCIAWTLWKWHLQVWIPALRVICARPAKPEMEIVIERRIRRLQETRRRKNLGKKGTEPKYLSYGNCKTPRKSTFSALLRRNCLLRKYCQRMIISSNSFRLSRLYGRSWDCHMT